MSSIPVTYVMVARCWRPLTTQPDVGARAASDWRLTNLTTVPRVTWTEEMCVWGGGRGEDGGGGADEWVAVEVKQSYNGQ